MGVQFKFRELYILHSFHADSLAIQAGTTPEVIRAMINEKPVARRQAEDVLFALSRRTGRAYSLANVAIQLLPEEIRIRPYHPYPYRPTFKEIMERHNFTDPGGLAIAAQVPERIVYAMRDERPVLRDHASQVLSAFSRLVNRSYTLATVAIMTHEANYGF